MGDDLATMLDVFDHDPVKAREIHLRLLDVFTALFTEPSPAPLKAGLAMVGLPGGGLRLPLVAASDAASATLREALVAAGVELSGG